VYKHTKTPNYTAS